MYLIIETVALNASCVLALQLDLGATEVGFDSSLPPHNLDAKDCNGHKRLQSKGATERRLFSADATCGWHRLSSTGCHRLSSTCVLATCFELGERLLQGGSGRALPHRNLSTS